MRVYPPPVLGGKNVTWLIYLPLRNAPETIVLEGTAVIFPQTSAIDTAPKFAG